MGESTAANALEPGPCIYVDKVRDSPLKGPGPGPAGLTRGPGPGPAQRSPIVASYY